MESDPNLSYGIDPDFDLKFEFRKWVESRDHRIVRAQEKVSKGRPKTPPKSCSVDTDPQA